MVIKSYFVFVLPNVRTKGRGSSKTLVKRSVNECKFFKKIVRAAAITLLTTLCAFNAIAWEAFYNQTGKNCIGIIITVACFCTLMYIVASVVIIVIPWVHSEKLIKVFPSN
jgi:hypothetical protein